MHKIMLLYPSGEVYQRGEDRCQMNVSASVANSLRACNDLGYISAILKKNGNYKMKSGIVYTCFSTDFLIEEADTWRMECWSMIKERQDCTFLFLTKRIERFIQCVPNDWSDGYENVIVCCTVENQKNADKKLSVFRSLPIRHKCITAQPLLERIDIEQYLDDIEFVVVGGESDYCARPLDYDWVLAIREQCVRKNVSFEFRQCGTHFIKDGTRYKLQTKDLCSQAKKAGINFAAI